MHHVVRGRGARSCQSLTVHAEDAASLAFTCHPDPSTQGQACHGAQIYCPSGDESRHCSVNCTGTDNETCADLDVHASGLEGVLSISCESSGVRTCGRYCSTWSSGTYCYGSNATVECPDDCLAQPGARCAPRSG